MVSQIFVNLPVKNLTKTMAFWKKLGFKFNPKFTDENAASLMIGKNMFAMLITEKFFKTFTKKRISDAKRVTEVLIALQVGSIKEVDSMVAKAIQAGGRMYRKPEVLDFMYTKVFEDLDGHQWEIFYFNMKKFPKKKK
ncbi:MAG TPA: VOC family protein [Candidatus Norongarragalinales archaeon]|nr:VOC family protein [Candidatus Norongarragalinales archaeon]